MIVDCHVCGGGMSFLMQKEEYPLYRCSKCFLVALYPQPDQTFLKEKVYSFESGYQGNKVSDFSHLVEDTKTRHIFNVFEKNGVRGNLLDVGCSNGEFLYHAKRRGFETYGVELNKRTGDIARKNGLNVFQGILEEAHFESNFFDAIFLGDVIEHVKSPRTLIHECNRILKTGGVIIISTPNLDCLWSKSTLFLYRMFRIPWSSVTPPHHLFQFSIDNLKTLMVSLSFNSVSVWYLPPPRLMYELGALHLLRRFKRFKTIWNFIFLIFSYTLYVLLYGFIRLIHIFLKKDFSMIAVFKKNA